MVISSTHRGDRELSVSSDFVLDTLEHLNLLQRANHGVNMARVYEGQDNENEAYLKETKSLMNGSLDGDVYDKVDTTKKDDGVAPFKSSAENISYLMNGSVRLIIFNARVCLMNLINIHY